MDLLLPFCEIIKDISLCRNQQAGFEEVYPIIGEHHHISETIENTELTAHEITGFLTVTVA